LFRGPENAQINTMELRRIKVDIHRNIPVKGSITELQRDIVNPEDVILKRREGKMLHFLRNFISLNSYSLQKLNYLTLQ